MSVVGVVWKGSGSLATSVQVVGVLLSSVCIRHEMTVLVRVSMHDPFHTHKAFFLRNFQLKSKEKEK